MMLKSSTKEALTAYAFLLPNLAGFLVFTSVPVFVSLALAFTKWDLIAGPPVFVGLENFQKMLHDPKFWKYCGNTLYLMGSIPLGMAGSLILALAMNQKFRGVVFFRTVYFLPTISAGVAIYMLWRLVYATEFGYANMMIAKLGNLLSIPLKGPNWLNDERWAKPALIFMSVWQQVGGYNMILYLAALQGVPRELYEAADIDGANGWYKFWAVTWPMISPTTFFIAVMSVIGGFQAGFDPAYIMTSGGPNGSTTTIIYEIFNEAFIYQNMGYACAMAWVLFMVIFVFTLVKWKVFHRFVNY